MKAMTFLLIVIVVCWVGNGIWILINSDLLIVAIVVFVVVSAMESLLFYFTLKGLTFNLTISEDNILYNDLFTRKEISVDAVKGFRIILSAFSDPGWAGYEVIIESKTGVKIKIPKRVDNQDVLIDWLALNFTNLGSIRPKDMLYTN